MTRSSIIVRRFATLIVPTAAMALANPAIACMGPYDATTFLLQTIPTLQDGEFAAEIEILSEAAVLPIQARVVRVLAG